MKIYVSSVFIDAYEFAYAAPARFSFGNIVSHVSRLETTAASQAMAYNWFFKAFFGVNIKQPFACFGDSFLDEDFRRIVFYPFIFITRDMDKGGR